MAAGRRPYPGWNVLVGERVYRQSPGTGRFQTPKAIPLAQPHDAEDRAVTLFGVLQPGKDAFDELCGGRAGLLGPAGHPGRGPLHVFGVVRRPVAGVGHVGAFSIDPPVAGHPPPLVEDLHDVGREPDLHFLRNQLVRGAVVVEVHGNVVIDIHFGLLPFGHLITGRWQGFQGGPG